MTLIPVAERFDNGAVTTCFYDLGLSRLGIEHSTFGMRCERIQTLNYWELSSKQGVKSSYIPIFFLYFQEMAIFPIFQFKQQQKFLMEQFDS